MYVFIVLISIAGESVDPWGVYSTSERAMEEQLRCRHVYGEGLSPGVFKMEKCEIWKYRVDSDEHRWWPRPEVPQPLADPPQEF